MSESSVAEEYQALLEDGTVAFSKAATKKFAEPQNQQNQWGQYRLFLIAVP